MCSAKSTSQIPLFLPARVVEFLPVKNYEKSVGHAGMSAKIWINTLDFGSPLEFSKVCLMIERKTMTLLI